LFPRPSLDGDVPILGLPAAGGLAPVVSPIQPSDRAGLSGRTGTDGLEAGGSAVLNGST
jgi:hypothetical protein